MASLRASPEDRPTARAERWLRLLKLLLTVALLAIALWNALAGGV